MTQEEKLKNNRMLVLVRGIGDVGSAIIWKLLHAGFRVVGHEDRRPKTIRRRMAFSDVISEGESVFEGITAYRIEHLDDFEISADPKRVGVYGGNFEDLIAILKPDVIIDSRIQKFTDIKTIRGSAALTIGVGPSFIARKHVDYVIESCWGDHLGDVIEDGTAIEPVPVPPRLNGFGWERFLLSETAGFFVTHKEIGAYVEKNEVIGRLDEINLLAPLSGYLRGLMHSGFNVEKGEKICEIDPRDLNHKCEGLAERPQAISEGVLNAIQLFRMKIK